MCDRAALLTLEDEDGYQPYQAALAKAEAEAVPLTVFTAGWLNNVRGRDLIKLRREVSHEVAQRDAILESKSRVLWGSFRMSARSCISAS